MAKATKDINTPSIEGRIITLGVAASTQIFAGTLVATNAAGYAVPAADAAGLKVIGRANQAVDNTKGANGKLDIEVQRTTFRYANSIAKPVTRVNIGKPVFVEDDSTVASDSTNKITAGVAVAIEDAGVWVDTQLTAIAGA